MQYRLLGLRWPSERHRREFLQCLLRNEKSTSEQLLRLLPLTTRIWRIALDEVTV
jgi:hypothetical protein